MPESGTRKTKKEQLEQKVDKHNGFAEKIPVPQEKLNVANKRIADLEAQREKFLQLVK